MPATQILPIGQLIKTFKDQSLPLAHWTHEAHLRTGLWHAYHYAEAEATCWLRAGIISLNYAHGVANTPTGGYHETITLFWIEMLSRFVQQFPSGTLFEEIEENFLGSRVADKNLPLQYYSRERLLSTAARSRWLEPDLQPLPEIPGKW